jgi:hypothetical protein
MVTVLDHEGLNASDLIETIIAAIDARIGTYLIVPGPAGYTSCRKLVNSALGDALGRKDVIALQRLLQEQYAEAASKLNETRPVVLTASV